MDTEQCVGDMSNDAGKCGRAVEQRVGVMAFPMCTYHIGKRAERRRVADARRCMEPLFGIIGTAEINALCRTHTGFRTLPEAFAGDSYRPSLYTTPRSKRAADVLEASIMQRLADAYDAVAAHMGDTRRAYRGES
jgi:hypothetical protein